MQPLVFVRRVATFYIGGSSVIIFKGTCLGNSCHVDVGGGLELHRQFQKTQTSWKNFVKNFEDCG